MKWDSMQWIKYINIISYKSEDNAQCVYKRLKRHVGNDFAQLSDRYLTPSLIVAPYLITASADQSRSGNSLQQHLASVYQPAPVRSYGWFTLHIVKLRT